MIFDMNGTMNEAMQRMSAGDLTGATRVIQRRLSATSAPGAAARAPATTSGNIIEGTWREVRSAPTVAAPSSARARSAREVGQQAGEFVEHRFTADAGELRYKLFVPHGLADPAPPLVVMLHGCTQSPDDFARGTRMNVLAQEYGYVVAYPAQSKRRNATQCWNWFRSADQKRGRGEPALISGLVRHLVNVHGLDARRVYAAGLSAGGAMAAVLAAAYPDVYAAIGVHSGLPVGAAHDLPSAFAAMSRRSAHVATSASPSNARAVPAIVFHGDCDTTVDPCNGGAVVSQIAAGDGGAAPARTPLHEIRENGCVTGGRSYTRTVYRDGAGTVVAEQWLVHGGGHAWFGGDASGSYTDPSGPDASAQMLRFFSECARGGPH
jgi:poly(hydroxyalkanoate) depolymerase family esterase